MRGEIGPQFTRRIDEAEEKPFGKGSVEKPKKNREKKEFTDYERQAESMLDSHSRFFTTYAGDVSLSFRLGTKFFIDLERGEVNVDARWFEKRRYSLEQIRWALLHELTHFLDLANDSDGMMKHFDYIFEQAKKTGAHMLEKWDTACGANDAAFLAGIKKQQSTSKKQPHKTLNAVERAAYDIHHRFYNICDDIWDNSRVARKAPAYEVGEAGGQEVNRLYREKLFKSSDYRGQPRHMQFTDTLIREEMAPDETVLIDQEIVAALKRPIMFQGKQYTAREIIKRFIKPRSGRDTKASQRYFVLKMTLEPIFEELLAKDLADWEPKPPEQQEQEQRSKNPDQGAEQEGEQGAQSDKPDDGEGGNLANPFDPQYQEFAKNNPDQFSDEDVKDWLDKHIDDEKQAAAKKEQGGKDEKKTPAEKARDTQKALDTAWCERHGIPYQKLVEYRKIEAEIAPYLEEMSALWQQIVYGSGRQLERDTTGYHKTGNELDVPHLIDTYPGVVSEHPHIAAHTAEETRVMLRTDFKERLVEKPELIRVRLVGDRSGSMDAQKTRILQQCFVLLLSSLREFNTYLNLTRSQTKSKLRVETEGWIFGDTTERIKHLNGDEQMEDEQVEIIKQFARLQETLGSTYDHTALQAIRESFTDDDVAQMGKGKIMDITIEVTDGGSSNQSASRQAVDVLDALGEIVRAFQIGKTSEEENSAFETVWNKDRSEPYGARVGKDIANLLPAVTAFLKKYLGRVQL
ncbi:MAG: hypothetical protein HY983_00550 [Candidatus Magasanikbacteria bacterium]|nr:hypothetical protein [Candidatus Magasanikbacteria bacterium]